MKRIIASFAAATAVAVAAPALAGTPSFAPAGTDVTLSGNLAVSQTVSLNCTANFVIGVDAAGNAASLKSAALSGGFLGLCGSVKFPQLPSNPRPIEIVTPDASSVGDATRLRIVGLQVTTVSGSCTGDLEFNWNNTTKQASFVSSTITGGCNINGTLTSSNPAVSIKRI